MDSAEIDAALRMPRGEVSHLRGRLRRVRRCRTSLEVCRDEWPAVEWAPGLVGTLRARGGAVTLEVRRVRALGWWRVTLRHWAGCGTYTERHRSLRLALRSVRYGLGVGLDVVASGARQPWTRAKLQAVRDRWAP